MTDGESFGKLLFNILDEDSSFRKILSLVKDNSEGKIYLVGGTVSRTLASELYGVAQVSRDFDFVVDSVNEDLIVPDGWIVSNRNLVCPTFKKGDLEVEFSTLSEQNYIKNNNLEPSIDNFLKGVPFSIQALAFDVENRVLIGDEGIEALRSRKFEVHNKEAALEVARRKGVSVNDQMKQKAETMGFSIVAFDSRI